MLAIIYLPVFPNILPSTTCHVYQCTIIFPERLMSEAIMINIVWWCYDFYELHVHVTTINV